MNYIENYFNFIFDNQQKSNNRSEFSVFDLVHGVLTIYESQHLKLSLRSPQYTYIVIICAFKSACMHAAASIRHGKEANASKLG